ncbi:hypothetical protein [Microcoleus sp. Pol11C2]|uniref:hypothetical protein n=1 Tax=Microcoleus sp. Pol11C2 TaxID=3055389 RepID=UPI004040C6F6
MPSSSSFPLAIEVACDSREFNDYVQALKSIIPSNSSHPILSNILIEADAETQHLHLTAYNLEFGMQVSFGANVNQSGKLTLPAPILADILGKFPNGSLTLKSYSEIIRPLAKKIYVIIRSFKFSPLELTHNCKLLTTNYNADHSGDGDSDNDSTIF